MTTTTDRTTRRDSTREHEMSTVRDLPGTPSPRRSVGRVLTLARAETTLLLRNRTTLFNAVMLAPATVALAVSTGMADLLADGDAAVVGGVIVTMLAALALLVVVYYNLTTAYVARREELVLKRLLTGESTTGEVLLATAAPALVITLGQLALGLVAVAVWFELPAMGSPLLVLAAALLGTYVFGALAVASAGKTRTVEAAQLTTLPVLGLTMLLSGLTLPLDLLPDVLRTVAEWSPLHPVVELTRLGLAESTGAPFDGAGRPLLVLVVWAVVSTVVARGWLRIEPRR